VPERAEMRGFQPVAVSLEGADSETTGTGRALRFSGAAPESAGVCCLVRMRLNDTFRITDGMPLLDRIQRDMVDAMRARDEARLNAIRMIKAALKKQEVDGMKPLDENSELAVLNTLVKQRRDAAEMFRKGNRPELAEKEESERTLIEGYMPASASDADIDAAITAALAETGITSAKQMGQVMSAVKAKLAGARVDGKALSEKVRARLQ
jgi:hypothetical protein